jgi:uncharacterized protein
MSLQMAQNKANSSFKYGSCWLVSLLLLVLGQLAYAQSSSEREVVAGPEPVSSEAAELAPIYSSSQMVKHPQAKSVELDEPVIAPALAPQENIIAPVVDATVGGQPFPLMSPILIPLPVVTPSPALIILNTEVLPSTTTRLSWSPSQSFEGIATPTPVLIVNGAEPGPVLCLTAALHGDELNGIEIVRRVLYNIDPATLSGAVIGVPIVNLQGFRRSSRYLTDRRDLNRYFPGNPDGSSAARIAYSFFTEVISHCNALVDLHTGSFHRTNLPQLRADVSDPQVVELTQGFGATVVLQSEGAIGTLRRASVNAGIPAVTLEAGESMRLQEDAVEHGVKGIHTLMSQMGMIKKTSFWGDPEPVYYNSVWVRADQGGILFGKVELGGRIERGDLLGVVIDPITNIKTQIISPEHGRIIGMALNQVVLPGFAAFHIGIRASEASISEPAKIDQPLLESISGEEASAETDTGVAPPAAGISTSPKPLPQFGEGLGEDDLNEEAMGDEQPDAGSDD